MEVMEDFYDVSYYKVFKIPKRKGEYREIYAPCLWLKEKQKEFQHYIYKNFPVSIVAHGFVPNRSIVTNAIPHCKKKYVLSIDIKDFFPSIKYYWFVKQLSWNYKIDDVDSNFFKLFFVKKNDDIFLPQGGPLSPYLSNVYLCNFDNTILEIIRKYTISKLKLGFVDPKIDYTRYADDITISGNDKKGIWFIYYKVKEILKEYYSLEINEKKIKFYPYYKRQLVCGLVVNEKVNLPRELRKKIRAMMHHVKVGRSKMDSRKRGYLAYLHMIETQRNLDVFSISSDIITQYFNQIL